MPLDPSIFLQGAALRQRNSEAMVNNLQNAMQMNLQRKKLKMEQEAAGLDFDKLIPQILMKKVGGQPTTPQEDAALKAYDIMSTTQNAIDPVTGNVYQKDRSIFDALTGGMGQELPSIDVTEQITGKPYQPSSVPDALPNVFDNLMAEPEQAPKEPDFDIKRVNAPLPTGNRKLDQSMLEKAAGANIDLEKKVIEDTISPLSESQEKTATYADRMMEANDILSSPDIINAQKEWKQRTAGELPLIGRKTSSSNYKMAQQAERNFINAVLRKESGAVISPEEFANAREQYFPQPEDTPEVIAQKAANRKTVIEGFIRGAGPAYKPKSSMSEKYNQQTPSGIKYRVVE